MSIIGLISAERLETYERFTVGQKRAVALHNHTLQLGSSMMSMIALLELGLRNASNQRLVADFGNPNWLLPGSTTLPLKPSETKMLSTAQSHARKAHYSKLSYKQKGYLDAFAFPTGVPAGFSHKAKVRARQALFNITQGQVISQTTIAFWKRLYSSDYHTELWKPSLKKVFPNKKIESSEIARSLEIIYAARNRVAHHEPIYGDLLESTIAALSIVRGSIGAKSVDQDTPLKRFSKVHWLRLQMDYESFKEAWETLT